MVACAFSGNSYVMFYNTLIQTFLNDESLFTDVKAIVDCPLKVEPSVITKACREKEPREIVQLLGIPGSDLEHPVLVIPEDCVNGRNGFLNHFQLKIEPPQRTIERRQSERLDNNGTSKSYDEMHTAHGMLDVMDVFLHLIVDHRYRTTVTSPGII